ncbi:MAG TPA: DUF2946 family protein [Methylophilaceae bacterium]|jgi:hypothetical protein|nr:DUF2946 family protein [Methylophilaceae bacterium]
MLRRLFLTLTLAFLFGLGQQGAAMHAISHYADAHEQQQDKQTHSTAACEQCVVYAHLAGAAPSAAFLLPPCTGTHVTVAAQTVAADSFYLLAYSARAPPVFA